MDIHHEVLQFFHFFCAFVVVRQQFSDQFFFTFFQWEVVGVSAKNVLKKALEFVDIVVSLPTEIEGFDFFVFGLVFLFFLDLFLVALFEVFNDGIVMVSVLLPEFAECISFSLLNELAVSDFESFLFESFDHFKCEIFVSRGQHWFCLKKTKFKDEGQMSKDMILLLFSYFFEAIQRIVLSVNEQ